MRKISRMTAVLICFILMLSGCGGGEKMIGPRTEDAGKRWEEQQKVLKETWGETEIYAYVKRGGELVSTAPMEITSYGSWDTASIEHIDCAGGEALTVGVYVKCEGDGNGAWGKIDDAALSSM